MSYSLNDTIAAIATAPGPAARGIVRLAGPDVCQCLSACFVPDANRNWSTATNPTVFSGRLNIAAGRSLNVDLYYWPDQRSYTRTPAAEIHTLGSAPLLAAVLTAVCSAGARLAEPGEFTLRAFLAGRIDLTQAEAVLGVIDARGRGELDAALAQLAGGLTKPLTRLRDDLLDLLAELEAGLDFAEEDIRFISPEQLDRQLAAAAAAVAGLLQQMSSRASGGDVPRVVLVGAPNVGKSSLFNALCRRDAALVADLAGTTRDYLAATLDLDGMECLLIDTAGVSESTDHDTVGAAAQQMTADQRRQSQVRLLCLDATRPLDDWERTELARDGHEGVIVVWTKIDAIDGWRPPADLVARRGIGTSSVTLRGLDELRHALATALRTVPVGRSGAVAATAARCRDSLRGAAESLSRALALVSTDAGEELVASEVRLALHELGKVAGAVYTDDLLDRIFSRFCIGK